MRAHAFALLFGFALLGCRGASPEHASKSAGAGSADSFVPTAGVLEGPYWTWHQGTTTLVDGTGWVSQGVTFDLELRVFTVDGLVYVGAPKTTLAEMTCAQESDECLRYSVDGDQITIGDRTPVSIAADGDAWQIDGDTWRPVVPQTGATVEGDFHSSGCELSTCTEAAITLGGDGTYHASSSAMTAVPGTASILGNGGASDGTYELGSYSIVLTPSDGGDPQTLFFFYDGEELIQIGGTWYTKSK